MDLQTNELQSDYYHNPVQRGFFPDPSVIRVGEDYYMVNSSFQYFPAIPISHSKDLIHWEIIGHAVTDSRWLDLSDIKDSHGIWAPDISYHNGTFYIFASLRLNGDGTRGNSVLRRQLVVTSTKPEGPYSRPTWLEVDSIDPSHFIDDDGSHYMILAPGARAVRLSDDCTKVLSDPVTLWAGTGERCPEGPHILKKDGWYYIILAEGGTGYGHRINIARSKNFFGPYESCPYNPILKQNDPLAHIQRTGHGKPVQASDGSWWMFYLCGRRACGNFTTLGRESALDPITFTDDGWFLVNDGNGPSILQHSPKLPEVRYPKVTLDDFDDLTLSSTWEFVRNPDYGSFSLEERPGCLRLYTTDGTLNEIRAKNILVRREQELSYKAKTCLEFSPSRNGEQAGLVCYYSTKTYIRLSLCFEEGRKLQLVANKGDGEEVIREIKGLKEGPVYLKVDVNKLVRSFSFGYDNDQWIPVATLDYCTFLSDEGIPSDRKRHTGTMVGLYASNGGCGSRIPADFSFFSYTDHIEW